MNPCRTNLLRFASLIALTAMSYTGTAFGDIASSTAFPSIAPRIADVCEPASSSASRLEELNRRVVGVPASNGLASPNFLPPPHPELPATARGPSNDAPRGNSLSLFVIAIASFGAYGGVRSIKRVGANYAPDWYHTGGPQQIGYSTVFDLEFSHTLVASPFDGCVLERRLAIEFVQTAAPDSVSLGCFAIARIPRAPPTR